ncbi:MAG: sugar MFS transporter [Proteobacteria bacterium]|nr:sugar MFS transporter [Pseudomonadota bacterium]
MHADIQGTPANPVAAPIADGHDSRSLRLFVFGLFFVFGGITSLNDVLIPKLKDLFTLNYAEVMLVQTAFFAAYFFMSLPSAALVRRVCYLRAAAYGLLTMTAGCLLFIPASSSARFALFLSALFVLASGITLVQVVANPLISLLGNPATTSSRLTFAQAFNSLGTTVFPYFGSLLILGSLATVDRETLSGAALQAYRIAEAHVVGRTYLGLAIALAVGAALVWSRRHRLRLDMRGHAGILHAFDLLLRPRFGIGALCIFLYVGAEVAIGSLLVNYLMQPSVLHLGERQAGQHLPFYWGGALIGRFVGSGVMRAVSPGKVLAFVAAAALVLLTVSSHSHGALAGWSLLAVGLCNSIMFPTIFALACEGLGRRAPEGSGVIATAIVGGAVIPPLTGWVADLTSLAAALAVPAACYAVILGYGVYARHPLAATAGRAG